MADTCERCALERWNASTPEAFNQERHCLAHSGALHQLQACAAKELARSRILLDRYRALAQAADAMRKFLPDEYGSGLGATVDYDDARAAVREIEEGK